MEIAPGALTARLRGVVLDWNPSSRLPACCLQPTLRKSTTISRGAGEDQRAPAGTTKLPGPRRRPLIQVNPAGNRSVAPLAATRSAPRITTGPAKATSPRKLLSPPLKWTSPGPSNVVPAAKLAADRGAFRRAPAAVRNTPLCSVGPPPFNQSKTPSCTSNRP